MNPSRRFRVAGLAAATALIGLTTGASQANAGPQSGPLCSTATGPYGQTQVASGAYTVMLGEWSSYAPLCLHTSGGPSFAITRSAIDLPRVGAFSNISTVGRRNGLPVEIDKMGSPTSTWRTIPPASGEYDITYDITIGRRATSRSWLGGTEVMVWLSTRGRPTPLGRIVATHVPVNGAGYTIRVLSSRSSPDPQVDQTIITFLRERQTRSVTNLDLGRIIRLAARYGSFPTTMYLVRVQAGIEIIRGGRGFATTYFSFRR